MFRSGPPMGIGVDETIRAVTHTHLFISVLLAPSQTRDAADAAHRMQLEMHCTLCWRQTVFIFGYMGYAAGRLPNARRACETRCLDKMSCICYRRASHSCSMLHVVYVKLNLWWQHRFSLAHTFFSLAFRALLSFYFSLQFYFRRILDYDSNDQINARFIYTVSCRQRKIAVGQYWIERQQWNRRPLHVHCSWFIRRVTLVWSVRRRAHQTRKLRQRSFRIPWLQFCNRSLLFHLANRWSVWTK